MGRPTPRRQGAARSAGSVLPAAHPGAGRLARVWGKLLLAAGCAAALTGCAVIAPVARVPLETSGSAAPTSIGTPPVAAPSVGASALGTPSAVPAATGAPVTSGVTKSPATAPTTGPTTGPATAPAASGVGTTAAAVTTPYAVRGIALVNRKHPLAASYVPPWADSDANGLSPELRAALTGLFAAAKKDGYTLKVRSGYRSYADQKATYNNALAQYDSVTANRYFAPPGASEHQTGLAVDVTNAAGVRGYAFKELPEAAWVAAHATEFGLIVRYPEVGEPITGIAWEPWHLRYVGKAVAADFAARPGLTLEEYLGEA